MSLEGCNLIGFGQVPGKGVEFSGFDPANARKLPPAYRGASAAQVDQACTLAEAAATPYRLTNLEARAAFLDTIADEIEALGNALIERVHAETGLPKARADGERTRTTAQLRMFAGILRDGDFLDVRQESALPDRQPVPRPDLYSYNIAIGPVAVFGASNFPLAFGVAGGDTAAALAAGCPVLAKAHPAHPGTCELIGRALQTAARLAGMPEGTFSLLFDGGTDVGSRLVANPAVKAVAFTGSRSAVTALSAILATRPEPIPIFAEMGSTNPIFMLPGALASAREKVDGYLASLQKGAGQFCTKPGLILAVKGPELDEFLAVLGKQVPELSASTMLTPAIRSDFLDGVRRLQEHPGTRLLAQGRDDSEHNGCPVSIFCTSASAVLNDDGLTQEVFGSCGVIVECSDSNEMLNVARSLTGQLAAGIHFGSSADYGFAEDLLHILETKAGRIVFDGYPTGVDVGSSMVHGGPFPATTDGRFTSVGTRAIDRFLRPVCLQEAPAALKPAFSNSATSQKSMTEYA